MKKKSKPLGKVNEARRKAEAQALFNAMMLNGKATIQHDSRTKRLKTRADRLRHALGEY